MKENKKDWRPIIVYLAAFIGIQIIGGAILGQMIPQDNEEAVAKALSLINIVSYLVTFLIMLAIYHNRIFDDCKRLNGKNAEYIIVCAVVLLAGNFALSALLRAIGADMTNQEAVSSTLSYYKPLTIMTVALFAPLVEELVFRYSFSTLFKKDVVFVIVSALIFALLHSTGIAMIVYLLMGAILAYCYLKTDKNIITSLLIHIINNSIAVMMMMIVLN